MSLKFDIWGYDQPTGSKLGGAEKCDAILLMMSGSIILKKSYASDS